jgi:hypothetical protein
MACWCMLRHIGLSRGRFIAILSFPNTGRVRETLGSKTVRALPLPYGDITHKKGKGVVVKEKNFSSPLAVADLVDVQGQGKYAGGPE